jgi:hypothetical protein
MDENINKDIKNQFKLVYSDDENDQEDIKNLKVE